MGEVFLLFWEGRGCYRVRLTRPIGGAGNDMRGARNGMRVVPCGLRPCRVRNVSNSTDRKRGIVGNDPRVVPFLLEEAGIFLRRRYNIDPSK